MNSTDYLKILKDREVELATLGFAGEFDGPVSKAIQDDLLADFRKDLAKTINDMPADLKKVTFDGKDPEYRDLNQRVRT